MVSNRQESVTLVQFDVFVGSYNDISVHWFGFVSPVDAMVDVKNKLLPSNSESEVLATWWGDPCLPNHWKGLACEDVNGSTVVTKM